MPRCRICNDLPENDEGEDWPWLGEMLDLRTLRDAGQNGCFICLLLLDSILHCIPEPLRLKPVWFRIGEGDMRRMGTRPFLSVNVMIGEEHEIGVKFFHLASIYNFLFVVI